MTTSMQEVREALKTMRRIIDGLEGKLGGGVTEEVDPYVRRREILRRIYWARNSMARDELMAVLDSHGTNYAWIGQQVKKGYLVVSAVPGGGNRYSVTPKAVREQRLDDEEKQDAYTLAKASEAAFAEDWGSDEDAAYDEL